MTKNIQNIFAASLQQTNLSPKQQAVLQASLDLFSTQGFNATSTKDIAQAAGVAEGTVYQQFKNKNGILQAILDPFIQSVLPQVVQDFTTEVGTRQFDDLEDFLTYIIKNRMLFALENKAQIRIFAQEIFRSDELVNQVKNQLGTLKTGSLAHQLQEFQRQGQLVQWPLPRLLQFVFSTFMSFILPVIITNRDDVSETQVEQWTTEAVTFLLHGLTPQ
ncbi:TetR/AcrR family transcriptional regulator [Fructilactobacillus cliffordii]|uniref:TetR/AcrR family transcriptional regulator n=1 Tax=Fructilactobacillus cliffordii TaxID=2940299 RepID=UPI002093565A|nr:TetR/AcrR family transcriptional regulator [Fructilactobacillus cliffordii]USS86535.1 TetR/AcrR family transcriptional regulator [Fructilactobacillus cliffordii]